MARVQRVTTRQRRERSASESLLSIVLLLEAILVFFVTLVAFGLHVVPAAVAFVGGAVLFVLLLVTGRIVGHPAGLLAGWVLQAILVALGILVSLMYFIGAVFLAIWIYCFIVGRRLDRQKAAWLADPANAQPSP